MTILSVSLTCSSALADVECDPDFPRRCSAPIVAGEVAPISGQVVSAELAIELVVTATTVGARAAADKKKALELQAANLALVHAQKVNGLEADIKILKAEKRMLESRPEPMGSGWVVLLSVGTTVAVIFGSAWAWGQIPK